MPQADAPSPAVIGFAAARRPRWLPSFISIDMKEFTAASAAVIFDGHFSLYAGAIGAIA